MDANTETIKIKYLCKGKSLEVLWHSLEVLKSNSATGGEEKVGLYKLDGYYKDKSTVEVTLWEMNGCFLTEIHVVIPAFAILQLIVAKVLNDGMTVH